MSSKPINIAEALKGRIGCSEVAAAIGVSKYKTQYQLWMEKTGQIEQDPPSLAMRLGVPLEPVIKTLYEDETGFKLRRSYRELTHPDPTLPLVGHLDFVVSGGDGRLVDCKSSLGFGGRLRYGVHGTDSVPEENMCQGQAYMLLTRKKKIDFAVLMAGPEFRIFTVEADKDLQQLIEAGIRVFWRYVETNTPPPIINSEDASIAWPHSTLDKALTATAEQVRMAENLRALRAEISEKTKLAEAAVTILKSYMEDSEVLLDPMGEKLCSWKEQSKRVIDTKRLREEAPDVYGTYVKETSSRVFRLAGDKP